MDWRIAGAYIATCSCNVDEHWQIDGRLNDTHGGCKGIVLFRVQEGKLEGATQHADLSGSDFALVNFFPEKLGTSEFWEMGIIVDESASDDVARAVEEILSGRHGGPFSDIQELIGEYIGMERAAIKVEKGTSPIIKIEGACAFRFDANLDANGEQKVEGSPLFPFATNRVGGKAEGPPARIFGSVWTPLFAEYARFDLDNSMLSVDDQLRGLRGYSA
ncbi:MAG: DUF1326 domain-containing protein [Actinomycetota bacterium]